MSGATRVVSLPMTPLICATSAASRLISAALEIRPLLTSLPSDSICAVMLLKRLTSVLALSSTLRRSAVPAALADKPLTASKKLDHTPVRLVALSENRASTRSAIVESCCRRASSPPLSSSREIASWSATRRTSVIIVPLPTLA